MSNYNPETDFANLTINRLSTNPVVIILAFMLFTTIWWVTNAGQGWPIN
jgi:hypothetical protein